MKTLLTITFLILGGIPACISAQPLTTPSQVEQDILEEVRAKDSLTAKLVDSRKGYVMRIPASALLDSGKSGWNPKKRFERRVYTIDGAGEIIITVTVKATIIPENVTTTSAYTYVQRDSTTSAGTAWSRTYYLPTRSVRIDIIPYGIGMHPYIEEREYIFNAFRWKQGADTEVIDVDRPIPPPAPIKTKKGLGR